MATKDQLIARATATEADRNEVFLQSEALREETFNEWLATKDITVPDNETMVNIANELIEQRQDMAELKTHHHDNRYATKESEHEHSNKDVLDGITDAKVSEWTNKSNFSGSYLNLTDKPTIPTKTSQLTNDSNFVDNTHKHDFNDLENKPDIDSLATIEYVDESKLSLNGGTMQGAITMQNSTQGKILYTKTDGTVIDGIYLTSSNNLRVGDTDAKTNIFTAETSDMVFPDGSCYEILHRGNIGEIPYITTNALDITTLEPGDYACIASRFINPPIPGEGGYVDVTVRQNENANSENPENPNIRKTIIVHYNYNGATYSVTSIGSNAFYFCEGLSNIEIPSNVTNIGNDAFRGCSMLTSVEIPSSVNMIGERAFYYCSALSSVNCKSNTPPSVSYASTWNAFSNNASNKILTATP